MQRIVTGVVKILGDVVDSSNQGGQIDQNSEHHTAREWFGTK
jgi:hypothetical protein